MTRISHAALAATLCAFTMPATAQAQSAEAKQFGAREGARQISISPDGARIAVIAPTEGAGAAVLVGPLDGSGELKPILTSSGKPDRLTDCQWSTDTRLLCSVFLVETRGALLSGYSRMVALNADGSELKQLSARAGANELYATGYGGDVIDLLPDDAGSAVLMTRNFVAEESTGRIAARTATGLGVERVDTVSLKRTTVERPRDSAIEYITDGHGQVRVMGAQPEAGTGYSSNRLVYFYRSRDGGDWKPLANATTDSQTFSGLVPVAVDRDLDAAYAYDSSGGRKALVRIALDGSLKRELVLRRDDVDVGGLVTLGRQHRVVGVTWSTDKTYVSYFDPQLKALREQLSRALPGAPAVDVVDASADESKLLLVATSDTDPGRYYLLDRKTKKMAEVLPVRPQLAKMTLATMKPVSFPAADGTMIPAYLTLPPGSDGKNLPAIVMPHGGPSSRDEWGFDWLPQFFAARGYAVLQPNYRGSAGYGEAWFRGNGFKSWRTAIGDINDGARWLEKQGIAAPGKLAIFGWSYGGYAALQTSVLDPDLFKAIVAVAPVTDLETLRGEHRDFTDYALVSGFIGQGPHVTEGSPAQNAGRIKAPVMLFHGDRDLNVDVGESRLMASKLRGAGKQVDYVEFAGLDHQLDDNQARTQLLDKSDGFFRTALGLPARP